MCTNVESAVSLFTQPPNAGVAGHMAYYKDVIYEYVVVLLCMLGYCFYCGRHGVLMSGALDQTNVPVRDNKVDLNLNKTMVLAEMFPRPQNLIRHTDLEGRLPSLRCSSRARAGAKSSTFC